MGNNVYGNEYNGKCWEPLDEYKGDFARSYLYMFTCYENINWQKNCTTMLNLNSGTYPMLRDWAADLLVEWCNNDPVSEKELKRAEGIYGIQNNRNPFIDYPELVDYLWGDMAGEPFYFNDNDAPRLIYPKSNQVFTMPEVHYLSSSSMKLTIAA